MNKCEQCLKEYEPKRTSSRYCSDNCRIAYHRHQVSVTDDPLKVSVTEVEPASLADYNDPDGRKYCRTRANPELLNWGEPMSSNELHKAGLKANRVPIPGDHDYKGIT